MEKCLFIGDVHSRAESLQRLAKGWLDAAEFPVVFLGDYLDRGPMPLETLEFLLHYADSPNVVFLKGNHEAPLECWASGLPTEKPEFLATTLPFLEGIAGSTLNLRRATLNWIRKMVNSHIVKMGPYSLLCTHGGVADFSGSAQCSPVEIIKGTGAWNELDIAHGSFAASLPSQYVYQVSGHRHRKDGLQISPDGHSVNLDHDEILLVAVATLDDGNLEWEIRSQP